jgi:aspartyl-tRNA(Asn)/glutamyl-tRNA(Gln) amidotransferase subunit C
MKLSREEVVHIATIYRLGLSEEEIEKAREQIANILENFEILKEVDTTNIPPTAQSVNLQNIMRDDVPHPSLPMEEVMANAPAREEDFFKLRPVLE